MSATERAAARHPVMAARYGQRGAGAELDGAACRVRIVGTPADVAAMVAGIRLVADVQQVSPHFPAPADEDVTVFVHCRPVDGVEALARVVTT